jgi:hypothetical protein
LVVVQAKAVINVLNVMRSALVWCATG